jgi:hypothetical protein
MLRSRRIAPALAGLLALLCCAALAPAAETTAPATPTAELPLPAGTRWVARLDVRGLLDSGVGELLRTEIEKRDLQPQLDAFAVMFRIRPLEDLDRLVLCGPDREREHAILYAEGRFPADDLITILRAGEGYRRLGHGAHELHHFLARPKDADGETRPVFACLPTPNRLVIGGSESRVRQALDTLDGSTPALAPESDLAADLEATDTWFLAAGALGIEELAKLPPQAAMLKQLEAFNLQAGESGDNLVLALRLRAADGASAKQMTQALQGLQALALLNAQQQPEVAELAQALEINRTDLAVNLRLEQQLDALVAALQQLHQRQQTQPDQPPAAGAATP